MATTKADLEEVNAVLATFDATILESPGRGWALYQSDGPGLRPVCSPRPLRDIVAWADGWVQGRLEGASQ